MRREEFGEFAAPPADSPNSFDAVLSMLPAWIQSYYGVDRCPEDKEFAERQRLFRLRYFNCGICIFSLKKIEEIEGKWKGARENPPPMIKVRA